MSLSEKARTLLNNTFGQNGLRSTRQREHVFSVLLDKRDHPTADEVYARAKDAMSSISLATVYNCLETLVECDLVKQVNFEREPTRYCPNLAEHAHFYDDESGRVYDIEIPDTFFEDIRSVLPEGYEAQKVELSFRGKKPPRFTVKATIS
jgi:Fur family peroxide stress response transcriptional regulator